MSAPAEVGVFYYRFPDEERGHIFSITKKEFPCVVGDGRRSLEKLIRADEHFLRSGIDGVFLDFAQLDELIQLEAERQARKLILIPSESTAPLAVREAMGSAFQNIYAEGYPDEDSRWMTEAEILDYPERLAWFRLDDPAVRQIVNGGRARDDRSRCEHRASADDGALVFFPQRRRVIFGQDIEEVAAIVEGRRRSAARVEVPCVDYEKLRADRVGESYETIRKRVQASHDIQNERFSKNGSSDIVCNADMHVGEIRQICKVGEEGHRLMQAAMTQIDLSARAYRRILNLARTVADLVGCEEIQSVHLAEALQYRPKLILR